MRFEIWKDDNLIKRGTKILNTLNWSHELMTVPSLDVVLPIDYLQYVDGREEFKIFVNDKCFWGIVMDIKVDKAEETITLRIDHVITEWTYRQISINHAVDEGNITAVYKGDTVKKNNSNDEGITASPFVVMTKYVKTITDKELIAKAWAQAWQLSTGDHVPITKVDRSKLKAKEGSYTVTFSTEKGTSVSVECTVSPAYTVRGERKVTNKEADPPASMKARPFDVEIDYAKEIDNDDIVKISKAKAWKFRKPKETFDVVVKSTDFDPTQTGTYTATLTTKSGVTPPLELTIPIKVVDNQQDARDLETSVIDQLDDIYSDTNFAYPGWSIDFQGEAGDTVIDYVYSKQNKLEALTKTMELTENLFWRVKFVNDKVIEIGEFGEEKPYMFSKKPSGKSNRRIITEPTIDYDFENVINVATVYGQKSDSGMSSLTLREVYNRATYEGDTGLAKIEKLLKKFPVVILRSNVNNERDYSKYITQYPTLAPNNELEYAVLDVESINLESGKILEGSFAFNDLGSFNTDSKKITDKKRVRAARVAYRAAIRKLKAARRSYSWEMVVEEVQPDLLAGDKVMLMYDNNVWKVESCSNYYRRMLESDEEIGFERRGWFYLTRIDYDIDQVGNETNRVQLSKYLKINRETDQQ